MIAARITFGRRSFHAAANPTAGGIVSTGPYAYIRHPIYAAAIYFVWAGAIDHASWPNAGWATLLTIGAVIRMLIEERMLVQRYPEYWEYKTRTRRILPFVI
jgi:protein-S-isoprenylcysteine O-methyltransferase Ste14